MDLARNWAERKRFHKNRKKLKRPALKDGPIDEAKITRVLEEKERLIEEEILADRAEMDNLHIVGQPTPRPKIDRTKEKKSYAQLTMSERVEFVFRCKAKARAYWEADDNYRKNLWGGY